MGIYTAVSDDWNIGINDSTIFNGIIKNTNYNETNGEKTYLIADKDISFDVDMETIKNYQILKGLISDSNDSLKRKEFIQKNNQDTFSVGKAFDIVYVARHILNNIEVVNSTTQFKISASSADKIENYYKVKLNDNGLGGQLVCLITDATGTEYIRTFTISSGILTLSSAIASLAVNNQFELINGFDIVKEGLDQTVGYPSDVYVIKHIKYNEDCYIKFSSRAIPNPQDKIVIYFKPLSDTKPEYIYQDSIDRYDFGLLEENIDFPLTVEELALVKNELDKFLVPKKTISLTTYRPTVAKLNWKIPVNVTNFTDGLETFTITSVEPNYKLPYGQKAGYPHIEQKVTLSNYTDDLVKLLARLKNKNKAKINETTQIAENKKQATNIVLAFTISSFSGVESVTPPSTGLEYTYLGYTKGGYWNFSEGSNISTDDKISTNQVMVISGTPTITTDVIYGNYYINFDTNTKYGTIASNSDLQSTDTYTFKMLFNLNQVKLSGNQTLFRKHSTIDAAKAEYEFTLVNGVLYITMYETGGSSVGYYQVSGSFSFAPNVDYSLIFSIDLITNSVNLVINQTNVSLTVSTGGVAKTLSAMTGFNNSTDNLEVAYFSGNNTWNGDLILKRFEVLPDIYIDVTESNLECAIFSLTSIGLEFNWNEGTGTISASLIGGHKATLQGGTTWVASTVSDFGVDTNSINRYLSVPHSMNWKSQGANAKYTIYFIVKIDTISVFNSILAVYNDSNSPDGVVDSEMVINITADNKLRMVLYNDPLTPIPNYALEVKSEALSLTAGNYYAFGVCFDLQNDTLEMVQGSTTTLTNNYVTGGNLAATIADLPSIYAGIQPLFISNVLAYLDTIFLHGSNHYLKILPNIATTAADMKAFLATKGF